MNILGHFSWDSCLKVSWVYKQEQNHWPIEYTYLQLFYMVPNVFCSGCTSLQSQQQHREFLCLHIFIYTKCCQHLIYLFSTTIKFLHILTFMNLLDILFYEKPVHVELFRHFSILFSILFLLIQWVIYVFSIPVICVAKIIFRFVVCIFSFVLCFVNRL